MASFISGLLFLFLLMGGAWPAVSQPSEPTDPMCYDWGESRKGAVSVLEGEAGWLTCPLFSHPSVYNFTSTQNARHNLIWYHLPEGHYLEQPIRHNWRLSKERERLWLQPAASSDSGLYICMLRNKSSCSKIAMQLKVLQRDEAVRRTDCEPPVAVAATPMVIELHHGAMLDCPDLENVTNVADSKPDVSWLHVTQETSTCVKSEKWNSDREQKGARIQVHVMLKYYQGLYFCSVVYQRGGRNLSFTRSINVTAVYPTTLPKEPSILHPALDQVFTVRPDSEVRLVCRALFPGILRSPWWEIWWTVDGKTLDTLSDQHRFSQSNSVVNEDMGDKMVENQLLIHDFNSQDLKSEFNCSVRNNKGWDTRRAQLEEEVSVPTLELACGLGVTLVLMVLLFVLYHVFWLELLLIYRSWFGTDERHTDQSEAILHSMQRSRRLLFVLSPGFLAEKSFSLLECRLGVYLQHAHRASLVSVVYRSVSKLPCVEVAQLRQAAVSGVTWRGSRSEPPRSRFWLRLRLALPVRPLALGRRMIDSTSSHSDLAALALQRAQRFQNQNQSDRTNQSRRNSRTSANQSRRDRKAPPRGRASVRRGGSCREEGPQHNSLPGCAGLIGQVEDRGVELTKEIEQGSRDRTQTLSDPVPEKDPTPVPDSTHCTPNHALTWPLTPPCPHVSRTTAGNTSSSHS
ncbi:interleukin-1 receptor accessory protein isoform X2 [Brachyistius frenatus]|uniref:interleukin-1 receptor accessory protein isoform X2 n=1 Tax=Brachyistius frenatus TaxID=100188 RepID=UPI0037E7C5F1